MDLIAYVNIEELEPIMKRNGIEVPRLRGLRLMKDEDKFSCEAIREAVDHIEKQVLEDLICSAVDGKWSGSNYIYESSESKFRTICRYYKDQKIQWDKIHGKNRKVLKFELKKIQKAIINNMETFNKYAGRPDVLYIHTRIGGMNWYFYKGYELEKLPWFIEKVDDPYDSTYCDIYARIKEV